MKILIISNLYPPHYIGGYELGCRDVVEGLKAHGHEIKVLTSTYGISKQDANNEIYRWLVLDLKWRNNKKSFHYLFNIFKKEIINQQAFKKILDIYKPDLVYIWNLSNISVSLVFIAEQLRLPVCYYIFDNWLSQWEYDGWYSLWNNHILKVIGKSGKKIINSFMKAVHLPPFFSFLNLRHVQFASQYLKELTLQSGKPVGGGEVIHWGIDTNKYIYRKAYNDIPKRLLYVGQIVPQKGVYTAIEALKLIVQKINTITLTIVGGSVIKGYEEQVHNFVHSLGLGNNVRFTGLISHENMPHIYNEHDILIFPSLWDEPFGITILEAMASGLVVVGTATGGSGEILQHEINALVFPKGDANACAAELLRLIEDPGLFNRLKQNAGNIVKEKFSFERTINRIEASLLDSLL